MKEDLVKRSLLDLDLEGNQKRLKRGECKKRLKTKRDLL